MGRLQYIPTTMRFWVLILLVLSTFAASYPTGSYVVHGKRDADPVGMQRVSRAPKDVPLAVQIMLKQQNLEHGARFLQDVSDPDSPNFGKIDLYSSHAIYLHTGQENSGLASESTKGSHLYQWRSTPLLTGSMQLVSKRVASSSRMVRRCVPFQRDSSPDVKQI